MNLLPYLWGLPLVFSCFFLDQGPSHKPSWLPGGVAECATDDLLEASLAEDPDLRRRYLELERQYYEWMQSKNNRPEGAPDYVLPVVVHIIHQNGFENISDGDVYRAIEWLNDGFANINYYDQGVGVDTKIQFCLAQRDPEGRATNGVLHVESPQTNVTSDALLKNSSRWDPYRYINIWVVNNAGGPGGYATLPSSHGKDNDGVVVVVDKLLSIGSGHSTLIHELGHYLGLHHVFTGGCKNDDCLVDGDRVCDTPPDNSTAPPPSCSVPVNSCTTDANSGLPQDMDDLTWNYLDYGNYKCRSGYTQGQTDRMHFYIEKVRSSLLNNLSCVDPCPSPYMAAFTSSTQSIVMGDQVQFVNASTGGNSYQWYVENTPTATTQNFSHTFDMGSGDYIVKLEVGNGDPNCLETFMDTIHVKCPVEANFRASTYKTIVGRSIHFENTSQGGLSNAWYVNDALEGNSTHLDLSFPQEGTYKVDLVIFDPTGKCSDTKTVYIEVQCVVAGFVLSDTFPAPGTTVELINASQGEQSVRWTVNGMDLGTATPLKYTLDSAGVYTFCIEVVSGTCTDLHCVKIFVFDPVEVECERTFITTLGNGQSDEGQCLTFVEDGGILMASAQDNQIGFALLNKEGKLEWNRVFDPFSVGEFVIDLDYEGNGVVVGVGYAEANAQLQGFPFAFRYDYVNNQLLWFRVLNFLGIEHCIFRDVNINPQTGNYLVSGQIHGGAAYGCDALMIELNRQNGQLIWSKHYDLGSCETFIKTKIVGDKIYLVGRYNNAGGGQREFRMAMTQLDLNGNHLWSRLYVRPVTTAARLYATDFHVNNTSILLSGFGDLNGISTSNVALILCETDLMGRVGWCRTYDVVSGSDERMINIFEVSNGYLLSGNYISSQGDMHIFLIHVDAQGNVISQKAFGQQGFNTSVFSVEFFDGKIHLIGTTNHIGSGQEDIILLKLNARGEVVDQECSIALDLAVDVRDLPSPYDGLHPLRTFSLNATFDQASYSPIDIPIEKLDLCYEDCLVDTCFNGAWKDSVPDVRAQDATVFCNGSGLVVHVELCNLKKTPIPNGLPISVYCQDPIGAAGHQPIGVFFTTQPIDSGVCKSFTLDIGVNPCTEIYIVANDQGDVKTPLDLSFFEPNTSILECNYLNNITYTAVPTVDRRVDLGPDEKVCPDGVKVLDAGSGFASYLWSTHETESRITVFSPGEYWVEVVDSCGKVQRDTMVLEIDTTVQLDIGIDTLELCKNRSVALSLSEYTTYQWTPVGVVDCDTCPVVNIQSDTSVMVWLTTQTKLGCILRDSVWIQILPPEVLNDTVGMCAGDTLVHRGFQITDSGEYHFTIEGTKGCDTLLDLHVYQSSDTLRTKEEISLCPGDSVYRYEQWFGAEGTFDIIDERGKCIHIHKLTTKYPLPPRYDLKLSHVVCHGEHNGSIVIDVLGTPHEYIIYDMEGRMVTDLENLAAGSYILQLRDTLMECLYFDTLRVDQPDPIQVLLPSDTTIRYGDSIALTARTSPTPLDVFWSPDKDIDCTNCPSVTISPDSSRWYFARAVDENGCIGWDSIFIAVKLEYGVFVPNVFSPNGDQINDVWRVFTDKYAEIREVKVFDRWGELVYDSTVSGATGWDGQWNGRRALEGVYVYVIEYALVNGEVRVTSGDITLIR